MQAGSWLRRSAREEAKRTLRRETGVEVNAAPSQAGTSLGEETGRDASVERRPRRGFARAKTREARVGRKAGPGIAPIRGTPWAPSGMKQARQATGEKTSWGREIPVDGCADVEWPSTFESIGRRRAAAPLLSRFDRVASRKTRRASPAAMCVVGDGTPREAGGFARSRPPSEGASRSRISFKRTDGSFTGADHQLDGKTRRAATRKGGACRTGRAEAAADALPVPAGKDLSRHSMLRSNAVRP